MSQMRSVSIVLVLVLSCLLPVATLGQKLRVGFYSNSCPKAEPIVRKAVTDAFATNRSIAAGLIRLHFHDCFVRDRIQITSTKMKGFRIWDTANQTAGRGFKGCDASVLLRSPDGVRKAERDDFPNDSLRGFEVIDAAKASIERACPRTVSCADILAFAARDSARLAGKMVYDVPAGRRDGKVSLLSEALANLPAPSLTANGLVKNFRDKKLSPEDMVVLSGAHSIGKAHCFNFKDRIFNSNGGRVVGEGLSQGFAELLQAVCPANAQPRTPVTAPLDMTTPTVLDNNYYKLLPLGMGLLFSDQQLTSQVDLNRMVTRFAGNQMLWKQKFVDAMIKMGRIEVVTDPRNTTAEIRLNCNVVNRRSSEAVAGDYDASGEEIIAAS